MIFTIKPLIKMTSWEVISGELDLCILHFYWVFNSNHTQFPWKMQKYQVYLSNYWRWDLKQLKKNLLKSLQQVHASSSRLGKKEEEEKNLRHCRNAYIMCKNFKVVFWSRKACFCSTITVPRKLLFSWWAVYARVLTQLLIHRLPDLHFGYCILNITQRQDSGQWPYLRPCCNQRET